MSTTALVLVGIVAGLHLLFAIAEMFFWPRMARRVLCMRDPADIKLTTPMAFNQGFYNLLVVAGLAWAIVAHNSAIASFFLVFVILAGIVGALTVSQRIFWIQSVPAIFAFLIVAF